MPYHNRTQRFAVGVCHRRAGKTVAAVNDQIIRALTCPLPNPRTAYIAPYYAQAKDVAWSYFRQYAGAVPGAVFNEAELRVDFPNGGRCRLYGADNYDRMRGLYFDDVVLDEFGDMSPRVLPEVILPALSDRLGRLTVIGTPKGDNHFRELWDERQRDASWFPFMFRASETGLLDADELARARSMMTPDQYAQEYECSFAASVIGSYYGDELDIATREGRVTRLPVDPYVKVETGWDLGMSDTTAIWFVQRIGSEIRLVDFLEESAKPLRWYADVLRDRGYRYGTHYLPHDVQARELGTGLSRLQTLRDLGLDGPLGEAISVVPAASVADGINAVRRLLPRMWIDEVRCFHGVRALRNYSRKYDEQRKVFADQPKHDWASHPSDALRTYCTGQYEGASPGRKAPVDSYRRERKTSGTGWMTA